MKSNNKIDSLIKLIGCIIFVFGIIGGLYLALSTIEVVDTMYVPPKVVSQPSPLSPLGYYIMLSSILSSIFCIGFGEIINLLDKIYKRA